MPDAGLPKALQLCQGGLGQLSFTTIFPEFLPEKSPRGCSKWATRAKFCMHGLDPLPRACFVAGHQ